MKHNMDNMKPVTYNMIERIMQDALDALELRYEKCDNELQRIEWRWREGYVPFTDGGFVAQVNVPLGYLLGYSTVPAFLADAVDNAVSSYKAAWLEEHPDYDFDDDVDGYHDALDYSFDADVDVRVQFYAADNAHNESGEDELYISAGYNTAEYGRDKFRQTLASKTLPLDGLTANKFTKAIGTMLKAVDCQ
jgi:hypothetical protein